MRSTIATIVESLLIEAKQLNAALDTGMKPAQLADTLETFIHLTLGELTHLGSLLTSLPAHGTIATVSDLATSRPSQHFLEMYQTEAKTMISFGTSDE